MFTIVFTFCSFSVYRQLRFLTNKDLGFCRKNIIVVILKKDHSSANLKAIKEQIIQFPGILSASASSTLPYFAHRGIKVPWPGRGKDKKPFIIWYNAIDKDYMDLYEMKIRKGRQFTGEFLSDEKKSIVVNEIMVKELGWKDPIGKTISFPVRNGLEYKQVVGVMNDSHNGSPYKKIEPMCFNIDSTEMKQQLSVKIGSGKFTQIIRHIGSVIRTFEPSKDFEYEFMDDVINSSNEKSLKTEFKLLKIFGIFSIITLLLSCLGLYGLISFTTEVRSREIAIRKVLGASVIQISGLFLKELATLIVISGIIAAPISYYLMNQWLSGFAYRIGLNLWQLVVSVIIIVVISFSAMSYRIFRASLANPSNSLKCE